MRRHGTPWPTLVLCALGLFALGLAGCSGNDRAATARVTVVVTAEDLPGEGRVYIAGNLPELGSWAPGVVPLTRDSAGHWRIALRLPVATPIEFKITRGSWLTEAVDTDGVELPNFRLTVNGDTTLQVHVVRWRDAAQTGAAISLQRLRNKAGIIELFDHWRYHPGDSARWAEPEADDGGWTIANPTMGPHDPLPPAWEGVGWFRLQCRVDSLTRGVPLVYILRQSGASEIFLNGRRIAQLGRVGTSAADEVGYEDQNPRVIVFGPEPVQTIAVRYSNFSSAGARKMGYSVGFVLLLGEADAMIQTRISQTRELTSFQMILLTIAAFLASLHLLLWLFDRKDTSNLLLSLSTAGVGLLCYFDYQTPFLTSRDALLWNTRLSWVAIAVLSLASLRATYGFIRGKTPYPFLIPVALVSAALAWLEVEPTALTGRVYTAMIMLLSVDLLRVVGVGLLHRDRLPRLRRIEEWILSAGASVFVVGTLYQLASSEFPLPQFPLPIPPFYFGFLVFGLTISLHLTLKSSSTRRELAAQLDTVRQLSERALEQERRAREEEVSLRLLEADNRRKTEELEEARRVQLAMLPTSLPSVPGLMLAVHMETATEVGGDYYDFRIDHGDTLTIAVGDATGHGMKAGLMVTLIKSLFNTLGHSFYIPDFFQYCTTAIRRMNMERLYMSLLLARFSHGTMTVSSAGMPPCCVFHSATGRVEEIRLTGMPLGAHPGFPYQETSIDVAEGDLVVFCSDGFPERFNCEGEILDYSRLATVVGEAGRKEPAEVIDRLLQEAREWSGGAPLNDDMTFVVVKVLREAGATSAA